MTQTIEQLTARVRELEEENARLNTSPTIEACRQMIHGKAVIEASALREQLADALAVLGADSQIEAEAVMLNYKKQVSTLTRQRDLAVYGLNEAEVYLTYCKPIEAMREIRKALSAIKESEGK